MVDARVRRRATWALLAALSTGAVSGCAGGGASPPVPAVAASARTLPAAPTTSVSFTISVPPRTAQAKSRIPAYVSVNTQSVVITLASVNGAPYAGSQASIATNLATSNPACGNAGGTLTCTVSAPAVPGNDNFSVGTYDAQQTSAQPATPAGDLLSSATLAITVVAGVANAPSTPLVLNGIAATVAATFAPNAHVSGSATGGFAIVGNQPYTMTFTAMDASGATIVGPGTPVLTSTSSALSISAVNADTYTVQVKAYSATPLTATVTPSAGSSTTLSFTTVQELWASDYSDGAVYGFAMDNGTYPSIAADTITGLAAPFGLAFDAGAHLWVAQYLGNVISEYAPGSGTVLATITAGVNGPAGIAFDATGNLWVANTNAGVTEYHTANGAPVAFTLNAGMNSPNDVAFDPSGNVWVANYGSDEIDEYAPGTDAVVASIADASLPNGLAFDANGDLWATRVNGASVDEYAPPLVAGDPRAATISSGLIFPQGEAFDATGHLYVASTYGTGVSGFSPVNAAAPMPGTPIPVTSSGFVKIAP